MAYIIKETRSEYNLTQQELSDITGIPKRTIENWESGKRRPSPWVEKLVKSYLKQCPKNDRGIITERKGTYEVEQIIK
jgi:DNA-binding transcriptional regulator YiaG